MTNDDVIREGERVDHRDCLRKVMGRRGRNGQSGSHICIEDSQHAGQSELTSDGSKGSAELVDGRLDRVHLGRLEVAVWKWQGCQ